MDKFDAATKPIFFEVQSLRALMLNTVLKGSHRVPHELDLAWLGEQLWVLRAVTSFGQEPETRANADLTQIFKAVELLINVIPGRLAGLEKLLRILSPQEGDVVSSRRLYADDMERPVLNELHFLNELKTACEKIYEVDSMFVKEEGFRILPNWRDLAVAIATLFRLTMHRSNPGVTFGNSNGGPVARFVSAVLPGMTGESVAPETVSAFLKRAHRQ